MPEEKNTKFCSNCGAEIDIKAKICPKCGVEQSIIPEKVSNWWYLPPIFLGAIGGLVAWVVNKDVNPKKARKLLIIGIFLPIVYIVAYFGIMASIVLVSVGGAKEKAKEARATSNMMQIRTTAEFISMETTEASGDYGDDYSGVNCNNSQLVSICNDIKNSIGEEPIIHSTKEAYCAYIKLSTGYYCIDSGFKGGTTSINPGNKGQCDGLTFVCP